MMQFQLPEVLEKKGYTFSRMIGSGSYGQAFLVYHDGRKVWNVVKAINMSRAKNDKEIHDCYSEVMRLAEFDHPNITHYVDWCVSDRQLYIVMEHADGGDLSAYIDKYATNGKMMSEDQILSIFSQMVVAINFIHGKHVIHRDLKPQNIFLTKTDQVKLGDFGISKKTTDTTDLASTQCGTLYYFSPELCLGKKYNAKSDIWALGCILYEMCTGNRAFDGQGLRGVMDAITKSTPPRIPECYSQGLASLIQEMLRKDPSSRPTATDLLNNPKIASCPAVRQSLDQASTARRDGTPPPRRKGSMVRRKSLGEKRQSDLGFNPVQGFDSPQNTGRYKSTDRKLSSISSVKSEHLGDSPGNGSFLDLPLAMLGQKMQLTPDQRGGVGMSPQAGSVSSVNERLTPGHQSPDERKPSPAGRMLPMLDPSRVSPEVRGTSQPRSRVSPAHHYRRNSSPDPTVMRQLPIQQAPPPRPPSSPDPTRRSPDQRDTPKRVHSPDSRSTPLRHAPGHVSPDRVKPRYSPPPGRCSPDRNNNANNTSTPHQSPQITPSRRRSLEPLVGPRQTSDTEFVNGLMPKPMAPLPVRHRLPPMGPSAEKVAAYCA